MVQISLVETNITKNAGRTLSHTHMHTAVSRDEKLPPNKKQDRAAKLPARFGRRDGLDGERGTTLEKGL